MPSGSETARRDKRHCWKRIVDKQSRATFRRPPKLFTQLGSTLEKRFPPDGDEVSAAVLSSYYLYASGMSEIGKLMMPTYTYPPRRHGDYHSKNL